MTMNEIPYYQNELGTRIYGSNRPGHSAWQMFDHKVAEALQPAKMDTVSYRQLALDAAKYLAMGFIGAPFVFIVLYHWIDVPGWIAWPLFFLMLLGIPAYGINHIRQQLSTSSSRSAINDYQHADSTQRYEQIVSSARNGQIDKSLPSGISSWARGAMTEEKIGSLLESLGDAYEVSHDISILQDGTEVANIDHLVSTANGLVMVDSKSWSGTVTVDQATGELTSHDGWNDEYRRKAIHSLRREAQSLKLPLRAVIVVVDNGKVVGTHNGERVEAIARILGDDMFDTYIVEAELLTELMNMLSQDGTAFMTLPQYADMALSRGAEVRF